MVKPTSPTKKILGYEIRKQQRGKFRVVEFYSLPDGSIRKRSIKKNLLSTDAEDMVYRLERNLQKSHK